MICQQCRESGLKSQVRAMQVGYSSNPSEDTFWDEEGVYHEHYLSGDVFSFVCANGHRWKSQRRLKCNVDNCDWNRLPEEAVK